LCGDGIESDFSETEEDVEKPAEELPRYGI